jgi:hypothetical protein
MSDTPTNHFSKKCEILADLWLNYKDDEQLQDFFEYNDIGIPLGYAIAEELAKPTEIGVRYVEETYALLLESLDLPDLEWEGIDEMFGEVQLLQEEESEQKDKD